MATVSINANVGKKLSESTFVSQLVGGSGDIVADATTADTDVGTVVSDLTAAFTAFNTFGAALVVIVNSATVTSANAFRSVWRKIQGALGGLGFNFSV